MINGLIVLPKEKEYIREAGSIQITLDAVSMFPEVTSVIVVASTDSGDGTVMSHSKYYEDNIKTKKDFIKDYKEISRLVASNRISGRLTVLVYADGDEMVKQSLRELYMATTDKYSTVFNNYLVDSIIRLTKEIGSTEFTMHRESQDIYIMNINGKQFSVLDMASYVYVRPRWNAKVSKLIEVNSIGELLLSTVKSKYIKEDEKHRRYIRLIDGYEIILFPNGKSILDIKRNPIDELESEVPTPDEPSHHTGGRRLLDAPESETIKLNTSSMYGSAALVPVIRNENNSGVANRPTRAESVTDRVGRDILNMSNGEGQDVDGDTSKKVYSNITEEDAMPDVYTGRHKEDKHYLSLINHYKIDGSDKEKILVDEIEKGSVNKDTLRAVVSRATYRAFMQGLPIGDRSVNYAIKRLKARQTH